MNNQSSFKRKLAFTLALVLAVTAVPLFLPANADNETSALAPKTVLAAENSTGGSIVTTPDAIDPTPSPSDTSSGRDRDRDDREPSGTISVPAYVPPTVPEVTIQIPIGDFATGAGEAGSTVAGSTVAIADIPGVADQSGGVRLTVGSAEISGIINQLQSLIKTVPAEEQPAGYTLALNITGGDDANRVAAWLYKDAITALNNAALGISLNSGIANLTIGGETLAALAPSLQSSIVFSANYAGRINYAAQKLIGDRPVINFSLKDGGIAELPGVTSVTYSIPYTPVEGEDIANLVIVRVTRSGAEIIEAVYENGCLVFNAAPSGIYGVGYAAE